MPHEVAGEMRGSCVSDKNCTGCCEERSAWIVAGAVLLGSLIIAASLLVTGKSKPTDAGTAPSQVPQPTTDSNQAQAQPSVSLDQVKSLFTGKGNITFGDKDSKVLFVEFSDPSCPYCHIAAGKNPSLNRQVGGQFVMTKDGGSYLPPVVEMKKLVDAGKAAFVWLYANGHGSGELATQALYCAQEKGKFWAVHDLLMSDAGYSLVNNEVKNDVAKSATLANFLKGAVSAQEMQACLQSGKYKNRITDDMSLAQQFGFRGTPSFFVNTTNFAGAVSFKDMQPIVEAALK